MEKNKKKPKKNQKVKAKAIIKIATELNLGRPTLFSQNLADIICEKIANGMSLRKICADDNMPAVSVILRWLTEEDKKTFKDQYAHAREEQAETLADSIVDIADAIMPVGFDGKIDSAAVNQARLRVDARKWIAAKLKPKKYGDFNRIEHSGKDGKDLIPQTIIVTHEELEKARKSLKDG